MSQEALCSGVTTPWAATIGGLAYSSAGLLAWALRPVRATLSPGDKAARGPSQQPGSSLGAPIPIFELTRSSKLLLCNQKQILKEFINFKAIFYSKVLLLRPTLELFPL